MFSQLTKYTEAKFIIDTKVCPVFINLFLFQYKDSITTNIYKYVLFPFICCIIFETNVEYRNNNSLENKKIKNSPSSESFRQVEVLRVSATALTVSSGTSSGFMFPKLRWPLIRENEQINAKSTTILSVKFNKKRGYIDIETILK